MRQTHTRRIVVAGVGFVGSYVLAQLWRAGHDATGLDIAPNELFAVLEPNAVDGVEEFNLARGLDVEAFLSRRPADVLVLAMRTPADTSSVELLEVLVRAAARAGVGRVILISSLAVYGTGPTSEVQELRLGASARSSYGHAKHAEEVVVLNTAREHGLASLVLRSSGLFGRLPAPVPTNRSAGAVDRVLRHHRFAESVVLDLEDAPDQYLYVRELGAVVVRAIDAWPPFDVINVGPGIVLSPAEMRDEVAAALGRDVELRLHPRTGPAIAGLDIKRLDSWFPARISNRRDVGAGLRTALADFDQEPSGST